MMQRQNTRRAVQPNGMMRQGKAIFPVPGPILTLWNGNHELQG